MRLKTKIDSLNAFVQANKVIEKQSLSLDKVYSRFANEIRSSEPTREAPKQTSPSKVTA